MGFKRLLSMAGAVLAAVAVSQVPEYTQQYAQRLGGAIDELTAIIERFDEDASASGLSRQEGLERYLASSDEFIADRGQSMQVIFDRHQLLVSQREALHNSSPIDRVSAMARYFDNDVGAAALEEFKPAVPVNTEGLTFAAVGLGLGYALVWSAWSLAALPFRRRRKADKIRVRTR